MDEQLRVLKMLEQGKITGEEANKLLEATKGKTEKTTGKTKWLRVKVIEGGAQKVNVKIPLSLVKIGAKIGGKININLPDKAKEKLAENGINLENISDIENLNELFVELEKEAPFDIVNVDEDNERVIVSIE